ncbi:hypothetical protein PVE_P0167 (plasmid) [Pseudomonas veronii 1YdBTEX2]|uniref:Uncharacterized protein n=1 Tax=Pseudomonas veronii 1YdBTEX2 TaxID=1295141 RepID=A0A1D3KA72_PSEVE|nr:hypothetical protein PVE_P0167 [Pseudomonas veronii 1YdBTEX2]
MSHGARHRRGETTSLIRSEYGRITKRERNADRNKPRRHTMVAGA